MRGLLEGNTLLPFFARHTLLFIDYIIIQYSFIFFFSGITGGTDLEEGDIIKSSWSGARGEIR